MGNAPEKIYLDYAAATPVDPAAVRAMAPYLADRFGNPGSVHAFGQEAIAAVDKARETVAHAIGARFGEIIFTSSATESNNLALRGAIRSFWWNYFSANGRRRIPSTLPHIVTTAIEHESILETVRDIERRGAARVTVMPVGVGGIVDPQAVAAALTPETVLVSVMHANNEIGTVQPIAEISEAIRNFRERSANREAQIVKSDRRFALGALPFFHTDAAQSFQYLDCNVDALGVDLMTLSSHKMYGPKGIGALYVRGQSAKRKAQSASGERFAIGDLRLAPLITGGGQEYGLRSGTENVSAIVGFAAAARIAALRRERESARVTKLRDYLFQEVARRFPTAVVNGMRERRLPNNVSVRFPGRDGRDLLVALDRRGIAISAGSACAARTLSPSHVLRAIGLTEREARECVRITLGRPTRKSDIDALVRALVELVGSH